MLSNKIFFLTYPKKWNTYTLKFTLTFIRMTTLKMKYCLILIINYLINVRDIIACKYWSLC